MKSMFEEREGLDVGVSAVDVRVRTAVSSLLGGLWKSFVVSYWLGYYLSAVRDLRGVPLAVERMK